VEQLRGALETQLVKGLLMQLPASMSGAGACHTMTQRARPVCVDSSSSSSGVHGLLNCSWFGCCCCPHKLVWIHQYATTLGEHKHKLYPSTQAQSSTYEDKPHSIKESNFPNMFSARSAWVTNGMRSRSAMRYVQRRHQLGRLWGSRRRTSVEGEA